MLLASSTVFPLMLNMASIVQHNPIARSMAGTWPQSQGHDPKPKFCPYRHPTTKDKDHTAKEYFLVFCT